MDFFYDLPFTILGFGLKIFFIILKLIFIFSIVFSILFFILRIVLIIWAVYAIVKAME